MNTGTIASRYAKALLEFSLEMGQEKSVYADMNALMSCLGCVHDLRDRLADPTLGEESKLRLLETAVTGSMDRPCSATDRFLQLVIQSGRADMLLFMASSFCDQYRRYSGIVPVKLVTAVQDYKTHEERLRGLVKMVSDDTPEWSYSVNPSIGGGFVLSVGGSRLDASVSSQLRRIRNELIEKNNRTI